MSRLQAVAYALHNKDEEINRLLSLLTAESTLEGRAPCVPKEVEEALLTAGFTKIETLHRGLYSYGDFVIGIGVRHAGVGRPTRRVCEEMLRASGKWDTNGQGRWWRADEDESKHINLRAAYEREFGGNRDHHD